MEGGREGGRGGMEGGREEEKGSEGIAYKHKLEDSLGSAGDVMHDVCPQALLLFARQYCPLTNNPLLNC